MKIIFLLFFTFAVCLAHPNIRNEQAGLRATFERILALIPKERMKALLDEKLANDRYLQLAVKKINSDEFGTIVETVAFNPAYIELKARLRKNGFNVEDVIAELVKLFRPETKRY